MAVAAFEYADHVFVPLQGSPHGACAPHHQRARWQPGAPGWTPRFPTRRVTWTPRHADLVRFFIGPAMVQHSLLNSGYW